MLPNSAKPLRWRTIFLYTALVVVAVGAVSATLGYFLWNTYAGDLARDDQRNTVLGVTAAGLIAALFSTLLGLWLAQKAVSGFQRVSGGPEGQPKAPSGMLEAVIDTLPVGIVLIDGQGSVQLVNAAARDLLGQPSALTIGTSLEAAIPNQALREMVEACRVNNRRQADDVEVKKDRLLNAVVIPLDNNGIGEVLLTLSDVTTLHRVEQTLAAVRASIDALGRDPSGGLRAAQEFLERVQADVERLSGFVEELGDSSPEPSGESEDQPGEQPERR